MTVETSTWATKKGLAQMLKGGVIMDVVTPEQAKIAEDAGAVAVMALERVPADIRAAGGVARMSDPSMIDGIMDAVSIPVMAKARIGHFVEAQVLEALGVDYIDESEVLTPADENNHIDKHAFKVPFVCGCRNLGEALRRINEGAAMIRTKGEAGTGNIVEAVRQLRDVLSEIRRLQAMREDELFVAAKELQAPYELVKDVAADGKLPVVNFVAGGISTPADAALVMQLGAEGVFVGSGIFKSEDPARMANAIVQATTYFDDPKKIAEVSKGLGAPMRGHRPRGDPGAGAPRRPRLVGRDARTSSSRAASSVQRSHAIAMKIGVLALQGAFREHLDTLAAIGVEGVRVREPADLEGVSGLILPGGESTTMRQLIERWGLRQPILDLAATRRADLRHVRRDDRPGARDRRRRGADPAAARRDRGAQRVRAPARLVRGGPGRAESSATAGPRRLHPRADHRADRARRRRAGPPRRRPHRRGPRAERASPRVPSRARRGDALPPACWPRWPPSTTTRARAPAGGRTRPARRLDDEAAHDRTPRR